MSFPQAKDYSATVYAKQIAHDKLKCSKQLSVISNELSNFADKCEGDGVLRISEAVIGMTIYGENATVINDAGWDYRKTGTTWLFYIK